MPVSKLITGFLLGVIVTLAVVFWRNETLVEMQASPTGQYSQPEEAAEMQRAKPTTINGNAAVAGGEESSISSPAEPVSNVELLVSRPQSVVMPQPDDGVTSPDKSSSARTINDDYPPEIAEMIENRVDKELQARYENDEREDSWATYMEGQLSAYFAQKPSLAQFYISLVDCRTSICSIHVIGYGPNALTQWNAATADIVSQPWFEFNSMSMNRRNPEPDILTIVLILTKKPPG